MRVITALVLAFAITGFAQQQPAPATSQAADPAQQKQKAMNPPAAGEKATLYVYRLRDVGGMFNRPSVYIDEREVARIGNGRFFAVNIDPGQHVVRSTLKASAVTLEMKPGHVYYIRTNFEATRYTGGLATTLVRPEQGWSELGQTKANDPKDIKDHELMFVDSMPSKPVSGPATAEECRSVAVTFVGSILSQGYKVVDVVNYQGAYIGKWYEAKALPAVQDRDGVHVLVLTKGYTPQDVAIAHNFCQMMAKEGAPKEMVEGTLAGAVLQADIERMIALTESVDHPNCKLQIVKQLRSADRPGVERWEVKSCDTTSSYDVSMVPSPKGGTDFRVTKSVLEPKKIKEPAGEATASAQTGTAEALPLEQKATNPPASGSPEGNAQQQPPQRPEAAEVAKPIVKTGEITENQQYKSDREMFSVTVPAAGNPFVRTYKWQAQQLKYENVAEKVALDYEEVVFWIGDFGQAYAAGVRRIPQSVLAQIAKEEEKRTLGNLADKALFEWRSDYAEQPQPVEESSVQTQFGEGLLRIYLAKGSSLLAKDAGSGNAGKPKVEKFDTYVTVLVVKKDDLFIWTAAEDDYMQRKSPDAPSDPKPDLRKALQRFFATMTVKS